MSDLGRPQMSYSVSGCLSADNTEITEVSEQRSGLSMFVTCDENSG